MAHIHQRADIDQVKPPLERTANDQRMGLIAEYERLMRGTAPIA